VSHDKSKWCELAEQAACEQDREKQMALVEELTGVLSQHEAVGRQRRNSTTF